MIWGYQCLLILLFDRKMICVYNRWDESIQHNGKWHGHSNFYSVSLNKICFSTLGIIYLNHSLEPAMLICNLSHTYFTMLTPIYQSVANTSPSKVLWRRVEDVSKFSIKIVRGCTTQFTTLWIMFIPLIYIIFNHVLCAWFCNI